MKVITVTEEDLDKAIEAVTLGEGQRSECCVLAQAAMRQIPYFSGCCQTYVSVKKDNLFKEYRPTQQDADKMYKLVNDFDDKHYDLVRAKLPMKIRLKNPTK